MSCVASSLVVLITFLVCFVLFSLLFINSKLQFDLVFLNNHHSPLIKTEIIKSIPESEILFSSHLIY